MAETDIQQTSTTALDTSALDFKVSGRVLDAPQSNEFFWENSRWTEYLGYYKQIPELKKAIDALAMWTAGRGWKANNFNTKIILENIRGWGEDTFQSIIKNMIIVKKINGDSYAEIIRDKIVGMKGQSLVNLKPLNPQMTRHVVNAKGILIGYEEMKPNFKEAKRRFRVDEILHFCNDRIGNEIHGVSVIEACKWALDARNEAMADKRRILHRSTIRIIEVDMDDTNKYSNLKRDYKEAIKNGEVLIVPKGTTGFPNVPLLSTIEHSDWIKYLENFIYIALGIPKPILGGSQEFTEASSKISYLSWEQPYATEAKEVEEDLWNQLGIKVEFEKPISLKESVQQSEAANTGQVGFQPTEFQPGRNE